MKKYRLKKWYPTLPKDWEEGIVLALHSKRNVYVLEHKADSGITGFSVAKDEVERNSDFWEKVKENYEIIRLRLNNPNQTIVTYEKGEPTHRTDSMPVNKTVPLYQSLKNGANDIYSVRRLRDGQEFSIGDLAKNHMDNVEQITGFKSYHDSGENLYVCFPVVQSFLETVIHNDQVFLFKTSDGENVYKGNRYFFVTPDYEVDTLIAGENTQGKTDGGVLEYFSTKSAAEQWAEENKPRYSNKQVEEALKAFTGHANFHKGKFRNILNE